MIPYLFEDERGKSDNEVLISSVLALGMKRHSSWLGEIRGSWHSFSNNLFLLCL